MNFGKILQHNLPKMRAGDRRRFWNFFRKFIWFGAVVLPLDIKPDVNHVAICILYARPLHHRGDFHINVPQNHFHCSFLQSLITTMIFSKIVWKVICSYFGNYVYYINTTTWYYDQLQFTTFSRRLDGGAYCGASVGGKCMVSKAMLVLYAFAV